MRIIGRKTPLGSKDKNKKRDVSAGDGGSQRKDIEIWEDFVPKKKGKTKQAYEQSGDNRFTPEKRLEQENIAQEVSNDETTRGECPKPREDYEFIETKLDYKFSDRELLERALTHKSALRQKDRADYERLEFLGDAVFGLSVAHLLSDCHPEASEGNLSKMRAALVSTKALSEFAKEVGLGPFIKLGWSELSSGGSERPSILADVMEAVFGAIYRDAGYECAMTCVEKLFGDRIAKVNPSDPKTELQEVLHLEGSDAPVYQIELVEGPVHAPTFVAIVLVDKEVAGRGRGPTKKEAHQIAATEVLQRLNFSIESVELEDDQSAIIESALLVRNQLSSVDVNPEEVPA